MLKDLVLDIFYNKVLSEINNGCLNTEQYNFDIYFTTSIESQGPQEIGIPNISINNKVVFDNLLYEYFLLMYKFYPKITKENSLEDCVKLFLGFIWINATVDDFQNPISFLKNRVNFFRNKFY